MLGDPPLTIGGILMKLTRIVAALLAAVVLSLGALPADASNYKAPKSNYPTSNYR